ncbi:MAG: CHAD domain-containing protein [Acidobacteria bacterium]|nr:CHAD domain-containing protein [Acidobacteriota bacterium]
MVAVVAKLRTMRARVEAWSLEFDDRAVLERGLRKAYRRGQRAMATVIAEPNADNFHEWRKHVNHLRHQLQLLQTLRLGKAQPMLGRFKSLADLLGLKNDLALLTQRLPRDQVEPPLWLAVEQMIAARDQAYTEEAIGLGQQLYDPPAKALLRTLWPRDLR